MNPNYPSLTPPIAYPIWFEVDVAFDEETEVNLLDAEYQDHLCAASQIASHIQPLGKTGVENPEAPDLSDEDDANDDSEDTESHDEEDDEEIVGNHTMDTI